MNGAARTERGRCALSDPNIIGPFQLEQSSHGVVFRAVGSKLSWTVSFDGCRRLRQRLEELETNARLAAAVERGNGFKRS
jgi:hypothetical protein